MKHRILVVDSNNIICELLYRILQESGFETVIAQNGESAIHALNHEHIDLALLDKDLSDGSGIDICQKIHKQLQLPHLPIIILSASQEPRDVSASIHAGAIDLIQKPFKTQDLLHRIKLALNIKTTKTI